MHSRPSSPLRCRAPLEIILTQEPADDKPPAAMYNTVMKRHAIIPLFIPHRGCPHRCVFCDQKTITARSAPVTAADVRRTVAQYLPTLRGRGLEAIELAFYGGSFTGIPATEQTELLDAACDCKRRGLIDRIRLSTRPDFIDKTVLDRLRRYAVDTVELGAQSFDPEVLARSRRGHTAEDIERACRMLREAGFAFGIQLMIGLPGDTREKAVHSAQRAAALAPQQARLYPTVVLPHTELAEMTRRGEYRPLSEEEAVATTAAMYRILDRAGVTILRVGLKSTDLITPAADLGGGYHPAFRQLVEGRLARENVDRQLARLCRGTPPQLPPALRIEADSRCFSALIGHKACNRRRWERLWPGTRFHWHINHDLKDGEYCVKILTS